MMTRPTIGRTSNRVTIRRRFAVAVAGVALFAVAPACDDISPELARAIAYTASLVQSPGWAPSMAGVCHGGFCPTEASWAALRRCESGDNPRSVSRTGKYRGLYQFDQNTWNGSASAVDSRWVGVRPNDAPREVQNAMARELFRARGWRPWPVCGRRLRA